MKFLLAAVNAKYIHSNPAIYSLRAYAGEGLKESVELAEYTINMSLSEILADIYGRKPEVIGFSCYIWNWNLIREILREIPKLLPGVQIWLGGPEVSYDPDKILAEFPAVVGVMIGEGEVTFKELLTYYVKGTGKLQEIRGLYLESGYTPMREVTDMNNIPFLYTDLKPFENKIIYYESSRGCPFRCSYCLSSIEKTVRLRDIEIVKKELQFFLDHKVNQVKFIDRTFNCNHDHAMAIWQYIHENDNGVTNFHFEISADILREDEIALLNSFRPGLTQLEIGVQTINPDTLKAIKRVMDIDKLEQIVAAIHKGKNVHQHLDLIAGLPFEDYDSFHRSFDRVYGMKPEQLQLGFLKVLKGSEMADRAAEYGIRYLENPPYEVLYTNWLSYDDVLRLKRIEEMVEIYYNSGQFTHTLPVLEKAFSGPFELFEKLADFYERKGYFTNSPARSYRYGILLAFAEETDPEHGELYRELLTFDMYLRENLKSRPEFASEISEFKETIKDFYKKEETERGILAGYDAYDWKQMSKMTHLEPFRYAVWESDGADLPAKEEKPAFVLFDYLKRNPLNYEAKVFVLGDL